LGKSLEPKYEMNKKVLRAELETTVSLKSGFEEVALLRSKQRKLSAVTGDKKIVAIEVTLKSKELKVK
jgi:hypothetical protein